MKSIQLISAFLLSLLICSLIVILNRIANPLLEINILLMCTLLLFFLLRTRESLASLHKNALIRNEISQALLSVLYYKSRNATSKELVERAIGTSNLPNLTRIKNKVRLGDTLLNALTSEFAGIIGEASMISSTGDLYDKVSQFIISSIQRRKERLSTASDSIQRYSTISMFISAILPSFLIFAYIGSTVLSQTEVSLVGLSVVLLIGLPFLYAASVTTLSRRLIENFA